MNKDYAEYRLNHFREHFQGVRFNDPKEILCRAYQEDSSGKFLPTTAWKFTLCASLPDEPGVAFCQSSVPIDLTSLTKLELDRAFLITLHNLYNSIWKHIEQNINEGN